MSARGWLFTFADLAALLLAFFVLALAMTRPNSWLPSAPKAAPTAAGGAGMAEETRADRTRFAYLAGLVEGVVTAWPAPCRPAVARAETELRLHWPDPAILTDKTCRRLLAAESPILRALARAATEVVLAEIRPRAAPAADWGGLLQQGRWLGELLGRMPIRLLEPGTPAATRLVFRGVPP